MERVINIETGEETDNPQTRGAFVKDNIINHLKRFYRSYKLSELDEEKAQAVTDAETFTNDFN